MRNKLIQWKGYCPLPEQSLYSSSSWHFRPLDVASSSSWLIILDSAGSVARIAFEVAFVRETPQQLGYPSMFSCKSSTRSSNWQVTPPSGPSYLHFHSPSPQKQSAPPSSLQTTQPGRAQGLVKIRYCWDGKRRGSQVANCCHNEKTKPRGAVY